MKKMMFILMIMTAFLASNALAIAPDDVTNPSFEDSTITPGTEADYWTRWDGGGATLSVYHEGDVPNAHTGEDYFEVGNGGAGWSGIHTELGQEIAVVPGEDFEMSFWARSADGSSTLADSVAFKFEFYATQGEGWAEGVTPFADLPVTTKGTYQQYSLIATIPDGMNYARATIVSSGVQVFVDDIYLGKPGGGGGGATSPAPKDGSINSDQSAPAYGYEPVTDLSWINPELAADSLMTNPNQLGVEVKFGIGATDPNFPVGTVSYSVAKFAGTAFETVALDTDLGVTLPLADDTNYYWQVIVTDFNGVDVVKPGAVWEFTTGDALPIIQAPVGAYMWVDQEDGDGDPAVRTYTVTSTYTDDGKSAIVGDPNFVTNDWIWNAGQAGVRRLGSVATVINSAVIGGQTFIEGQVTEVYETVPLGGDALRLTEETAIPGWQSFAILVVEDQGTDPDRETRGPTGFYYIGEDCGDATVAEGSADEGGDPAFAAAFGTFDVNNDCILNLVDFSDLAGKWLDVSSKKE